MLESQCSKGSAMVSIRTSDEGIKKDVVRQGSTNKTIKNESTRSSIHDEVWCTYCKKPRHTKETCWKLLGN